MVLEPAAPPASEITPEKEALEGMCRLVFNLRLFAVTLTLFYLPHWRGAYLPVFAALVVAGVASIVPLVWWRVVAEKVMRHPLFLFIDLVLGMGLLAIMGADSPFFYFTLGTALLAGLLHEVTGAVFFSVFLIAAYWLGLALRAPAIDQTLTFQSLIGLPALYLLCASAGVAVRRMLVRQSSAESRFRRASSIAAVNAERARMAREMHDSLAKTLQGISLKASALPAWLHKDPGRAEEEALSVSEAAAEAAAEARSLIVDLRAEMLDVSLDEAVRLYALDWSQTTGIDVDLDLGRSDMSNPVARWEVFSILREALTNIERHSGASRASIVLEESDEVLHLSVADDGPGFDLALDPDTLSAGGHYGVVGMIERAREAGGSLSIDSAAGSGTAVTVTVPTDMETVESEPSGGELSWSR